MTASQPGLPTLYPIVIPPITITKGRYTFSCSGENLQSNRIAFDPSVADALPLLEPVRTKSGSIKVHQPHVKQTTLEYWKAQCIFRGLAMSGTKQALQERVRNSLSGSSKGEMLPEFKLEQERMLRRFREANAAARDDKWSNLRTLEEKADADASRFLQETFRGATSD